MLDASINERDNDEPMLALTPEKNSENFEKMIDRALNSAEKVLFIIYYKAVAHLHSFSDRILKPTPIQGT